MEKIEHRLFSYISTNWRGQPLVSLAVIVSLIGSTRTTAGLAGPGNSIAGHTPGSNHLGRTGGSPHADAPSLPRRLELHYLPGPLTSVMGAFVPASSLP